MGIFIMPAFAIEAPADEAPPPPVPEKTPAKDSETDSAVAPAKPAPQAAVAFLGVVSAEVPAMLAAHLDLKSGEGIVVQALMPDGPAASAGLAVHDVITHMAGNPVGSSVDLTQKVAACKPGEKLHLSLIHQGKPVEIDVTLGTRPAGVAAIDPRPLDQLNLDGIPKNLADRVRGMIEGNLGGIEFELGKDGMEGAPEPRMKDALREMKNRMKKAMEELKDPQVLGIPQINIQQGATIRLMDEQGSIELRSNDGSKEVTLRDKDNALTWSGPWDTEQDKAAAPQDVRQRIDRLHLDSTFQGNGLRLHGGFNLPNDAPDGPAPE